MGKPKWLGILVMTAGSSMAAMIFNVPPQGKGAVFNVDIEHPLQQSSPTDSDRSR